MAAGEWKIKIDEKNPHKTVFEIKYGLFEHVKLTFRLYNSPATFSRVI